MKVFCYHTKSRDECSVRKETPRLVMLTPRSTNPWLINRGCLLLVRIQTTFGGTPPNNGTGLLILFIFTGGLQK